MAALQAHNLIPFSFSPSSSSSSYRRRWLCTNLRPTNSVDKPPTIVKNVTTTGKPQPRNLNNKGSGEDLSEKLSAIAAAAADRAEMHAIIAEQRNNWAHLLPTSVNSLALSASLFAGLSPQFAAFKLPSVILFAAVTGLMLVANRIQPSQLAEEQRNAARLFRQLERWVAGSVDVDAAMERVLALDKAYPLPLLPEMLEKFPETVKPAVWWPKAKPHAITLRGDSMPTQRPQSVVDGVAERENGWSNEVEEEMKGALRLLKEKDVKLYVREGEKMLRINRALAVAGPLFACVAAIAAGLVGAPALGEFPEAVGVAGGALAAVANTLEHGGQVGMVFELFRNCAGFYRKIEEEIESELGERDRERRENGEVFRMRVALQLGRSLLEMKDLSVYASSDGGGEEEDITEFAGKLF